MRWAPLLVAGLLASSSASAVPLGERGALSGASVLTAIAASEDGRIVGGADSSLGGLVVWDMAAPDEPQTVTGCGSASDVVFVPRTALDDRFFLACADGQVLAVDVDASTVPATLSSRAISLGEGLEAVEHLAWVQGDTYVHAVIDTGAEYTVHRVPITTGSGEVDDGLGLPLVGSGEVLGLTAAPDGGPLVIAHTDRTVRIVQRGGGSYGWGTTPPIANGTGTAVASHAEVGATFVVDGSSGLVLTIQHSAPSVAPSTFLEDLDAPVAAAVLRSSAGAEPRLWIADRSGFVDVYGLDGVYEDFSIMDAGVPQGIAAGSSSDDPVFVQAADATVRVLTDAPWVSAPSAEPDSVGEGEDFVLRFRADEDGTYTVRNGGPEESDGEAVASGALTADTEVALTLSADDLPAEGDNRLFVFVEGAAGTGLNSVVVTLDTPPSAVAALTIGEGDERLTVTWTSGEETDIDHYEVYLSDAVFDGSSLPEYTVTMDGEDVTFPVDVAWEGASTSHSLSIEGLVNDVRYYVALRAVDEAGAVGPLTALVSGVPVRTCSAAECAGDTYGCTCSPNSLADARPGPVGVSALALALLVGLRRRLRRR